MKVSLVFVINISKIAVSRSAFPSCQFRHYEKSCLFNFLSMTQNQFIQILSNSLVSISLFTDSVFSNFYLIFSSTAFQRLSPRKQRKQWINQSSTCCKIDWFTSLVYFSLCAIVKVTPNVHIFVFECSLNVPKHTLRSVPIFNHFKWKENLPLCRHTIMYTYSICMLQNISYY